MTLDEIRKAQQIAKMLQNRMELGEEYVRVDDLNSAIEAISDAIYKANQQATSTVQDVIGVKKEVRNLSGELNNYAEKNELEKLSTKLEKNLKKVVSDFDKQVVDIREFVSLFEKYDPTELVGIIDMSKEEILKIKEYISTLGETSESIRNKLETLSGNERLSAKYISGLEEIINDLLSKSTLLNTAKETFVGRGGGNVEIFVAGEKVGSGQGINFVSGATVEHDGNKANVTITGSSAGFTLETPTGTVNSSNTAFVSTTTAKAVIADNMFYVDGFGCTISGTSITMTSAPRFFIRAII